MDNMKSYREFVRVLYIRREKQIDHHKNFNADPCWRYKTHFAPLNTTKGEFICSLDAVSSVK